MSQVNAATSQQASAIRNVQSFDDLNGSDFLQLMITQLQQQDPLNPMDNSELVQQINSIRELTATSALTDTLGSVLVGQNIATASGMIGKSVTALDDQGNEVAGRVDRVSVQVDAKDETKRNVRVHIGDQEVKLTNIRQIISD